MKKLLIVGTLAVISFSASADSCQMLQGQQARMNSCLEDITQTNNSTAQLRQSIQSLERQLSSRADQRRAEKLAVCTEKNNKSKQDAAAIKKVNGEVRSSNDILKAHKRDIVNRVGVNGNKLVKSYECVSIDSKEGNSIINEGRFRNKQAIFIGEGASEEIAKAVMLNSARTQGYLDRNGGGLFKSSKTDRLKKNARCFPVYAKDKAERALVAVSEIVKEAKKVKLSNLPTEGRRRGGSTTPTPADRRGGRRG